MSSVSCAAGQEASASAPRSALQPEKVTDPKSARVDGVPPWLVASATHSAVPSEVLAGVKLTSLVKPAVLSTRWMAPPGAPLRTLTDAEMLSPGWICTTATSGWVYDGLRSSYQSAWMGTPLRQKAPDPAW